MAIDNKNIINIPQRFEQVEEEKARSQAMFASIGHGAIATDETGRVSHVNQAALEILGYNDASDFLGKWYPRMVIAQDESGRKVPLIKRPITKAIVTGKVVSERLIYRRKDGETVPVAVTVSPIVLDGAPIGAVQVFRDITEEKAIERAKDEFISLASHQMRTPLTSIRLFSELLAEPDTGKLNRQQKDYLSKIIISTERMIHLVSDILNVSRIRMGKVKVDPEPVDLVKLIKRHVEEIKPVADKRKIRSKFVLPGTKVAHILADRTLLDQVIHNLLTNAIRYTDSAKGKIEITLLKSTRQYKITVKDNGVGIPEAMQGRIFERFFRAENAQRLVADGSGLGLYLVHMIMQLVGGKVWFESKEGAGTTFYISIPASGMKRRNGDRDLINKY